MLPFSEDAKYWEPLAAELRKVARVGANEKLDPWKLAGAFGLQVLDVHALLDKIPSHHGSHLKGHGRDKWSGGVYPIPLDDGTLICMLNPFHSRRRNKVTLMEEVSHIHMDHEPSGVSYDSHGLLVRDYHAKQEKEAYGIGAAALLPWKAFFYALNAGKSVEEMAEIFEVSSDLIQYRIKITGGSNLYRKRRRDGNCH
ncbi:ImmA/IrrE family metallo-endopeptidase [Nitrospira sp. BLG_2]|jgi:hypothetical protein|uniref:ImmA/IrrE family metallo-endopeptidase n=1 Tax=Nitrospira sp. BLG_2 TaxID=3397507 RepID=UPI003924C0B1